MEHIHHHDHETMEAADTVFHELAARQQQVEAAYDDLLAIGLVETQLQEVPVDGPHRLLVLDESVQPGGAYKYYGAAYAVLRSAAAEVVSGTAGNFGACMGEAAKRAGKHARAFVPDNASQAKITLMDDVGVQTVRHDGTVENAIEAARLYAAEHDDVEFLHPYDNPDSVAALTLMAGRLTDGLLKLEACGEIDLASDDIRVVMQRGGGSGLGALAFGMMRERALGRFGHGVSLHEVRPDRDPGSRLNPMFDGLAVEKPGDFIAPLLQDRRFVQSTLPVGEEAVADASRLLYAATGKQYEPSALAGVGAILEQMIITEQPTVFVAVLSGRNMTDERRRYFMGLPGLPEYEHLDVALPDTKRYLGHAVLSGATAQGRSYTPDPIRPDGFRPANVNPDAVDAYYDQLEELGIVLSAASRLQATGY